MVLVVKDIAVIEPKTCIFFYFDQFETFISHPEKSKLNLSLP